MRSRTAILAALAGAAAVYLFDPIHGRSRRERLRSSITRITRRPSSGEVDGPLPENLAPTTPAPHDTAASRPPISVDRGVGEIGAGRPRHDVARCGSHRCHLSRSMPSIAGVVREVMLERDARRA